MESSEDEEVDDESEDESGEEESGEDSEENSESDDDADESEEDSEEESEIEFEPEGMFFSRIRERNILTLICWIVLESDVIQRKLENVFFTVPFE